MSYSSITRSLIAIEVMFLCLPAALLLLLGVMALPRLVLGSVNLIQQDIYGLLIVAGGIWGLCALLYLAWNTLVYQNRHTNRPWLGLLAGSAACIGLMALVPDTGLFLLLLTGPLIATAHMLYVSQRQRAPIQS